MINALIFFALLMILHYSLTILNINANALSLIFFVNANTLNTTYTTQWAFLARNGMEKAQKSTVFYTYFYNGNF